MPESTSDALRRRRPSRWRANPFGRRAGVTAPEPVPVAVTTQRATALVAVATAAFAVAALAVGALAIGRLAVGRLALGRGRVGRLAIDDLEVGRLRVGEWVSAESSGSPKYGA